jgi:hypothetical protein
MHRKADLFGDPRKVEKQGVKSAEIGEMRRKSTVGKWES